MKKSVSNSQLKLTINSIFNTMGIPNTCSVNCNGDVVDSIEEHTSHCYFRSEFVRKATKLDVAAFNLIDMLRREIK